MDIPASLTGHLLPLAGHTGSGAAAFRPGETLAAQVIGPAPNGLSLVAIGGRQVALNLPPGLAPGTQLTFQVQAGPQGPSLVLTTSGAAPAPVVAEAPAAALANPLAAAVASASMQALGNQNNISVLISTLMRLGSRLDDMPPDVRDAAGRLTGAAMTVSETGVDAAELRNAAGQSGLFLEANLATPVQAVPPRQDIKALLFLLRGALAGWLGGDAGLVPQTRRPPPPTRGGSPRASSVDPPALPDDASQESLGRLLFSQTDAALSRLRLLQMASLPDPSAPPGHRQHDLQMEIPFVFGQEAGTINLQVQGDGGGKGGEGRDSERPWSLKFALNVSAMGEVGADISLLGHRLGIVVWAERAETAQALHGHLAELSDALAGAGLDVTSLRVRRLTVEKPADVSSGRLLDMGT